MSIFRINLLLCILALSGCASTANPNTNPKDPLEPLNRSIYKFNDRVDKAVVKPVAKAYLKVVPEPARNMVRNFFSNLDDVVVTLNDVLQLKFAQAASDGSRFLLNSTFGVFGLFNFAHTLEKHHEDFGQTLGYWGVGSGPYLVLPLLGSSNIRDSVGLYVDGQTNPLGQVDDIRARNQAYVARLTSVRAGLLRQEDVFEDAANIDRYAFLRDAYLQRRLNLVHDGSPPRDRIEEEDDEDYPEGAATEPGAEPDAGQPAEAPVN